MRIIRQRYRGNRDVASFPCLQIGGFPVETSCRLRQQAQALPKALIVSAALGRSGMLAGSDHLTGALVFTFSIAAFAKVARPLQVSTSCSAPG